MGPERFCVERSQPDQTGQHQLSRISMAIDYSSAPFALYVSDTANNRVLVWKDSVRFRNGDPADLVDRAAESADRRGERGYAGVRRTLRGRRFPRRQGIAVNPTDGTLWVADSGNNRVLRFPRPVSQSGRISPDVVIGQADFTSALSAAVNASSLNSSRWRGDRAERRSVRGGQRQQSRAGVSGRGGERGSGGSGVRTAGHDDRGAADAGFRADAGSAAGNRRGSGVQPVRGGHGRQPGADFSQHAERPPSRAWRRRS